MCPSDFKWFSFKTKPWNALWGPKRLKCLVANGINPALAISWNPLGKMEMSNTDISNKQRCRRCPICGLLCSALLFSRLEAGALMIRQVFWPATRDATTSCSFMDLPHFSLPLHCSCINSLLARANTYSLQLANKKRAELHRELATWQPWFQHPFEIDWPEWNHEISRGQHQLWYWSHCTHRCRSIWLHIIKFVVTQLSAWNCFRVALELFCWTAT